MILKILSTKNLFFLVNYAILSFIRSSSPLEQVLSVSGDFLVNIGDPSGVSNSSPDGSLPAGSDSSVMVS